MASSSSQKRQSGIYYYCSGVYVGWILYRVAILRNFANDLLHKINLYTLSIVVLYGSTLENYCSKLMSKGGPRFLD